LELNPILFTAAKKQLRVITLFFFTCFLSSLLHAQSFTPAFNYPVGNSPYAMAVSDFNKDGKQDLVVANQAANSISVLLNAGGGQFSSRTDYPTGASPQYVAVGDFNGDGNSDVVVANTNDNTIGILLGNGDGSLRPMASIAVGVEPISIVVGDFNSDGRLDIAVANFGSNTVSILVGNGDGTFQTVVNYTVDTEPQFIAAGDLNGDHNLDLVTSNGVGSISVLINQGNGIFGPASTSRFAPVGGGGFIAAGDFNEDGHLDLAVANSGQGGVSILAGHGDGTFSLLGQFTTNSAFPNSIAVADFDGDGHKDLVVADSHNGTVSVLGGNGDGSFRPRIPFTAHTNAFFVVAMDFNGDARPDIAVVNNGSNDVSVLVNASSLKGSGWRMEGVNPSRTNVAAVKGPETAPSFRVLATNVTGNLRRIGLDGSLILVDRLENNNFGTVSSYANDGTLKWQKTLVIGGFGIIDAAVGVDGTVYISTVGDVRALDGSTGASKWTFSANSGDESSKLAIGKDGTIYFHNGGGTIGFVEALTAINPDGTLKWEAFPGFRGYTNAVFSSDESLVYLLGGKTCCGGLPIGNIGSFSTLDGHKVNDTPCDPRGDVYVFSQWNTLYSGNINNDLLAFAPDIQGCTTISAHGMLAVGVASTTSTGRVITANNDGTLGGLDQQGNLLWHSMEPLSQAFSSVDAVLYATAPVTNDLVALDSENGSVLWRQHFNDPITAQFLADDGNIYLTAGTNLFVSTPAPLTGTISVSTNNANATFTVTGPATYTGTGTSFVQANAPIGTYTISYGAIPGYMTPATQSLTLTAGGSITFTGLYSPIPILSVSPASLNFPALPINSRSSMSLMLANIGKAPLAIQSLAITDPAFQISSPLVPFNIPPSQTVSVDVVFAPTSVVPYASVLTIISNDPKSPTTVPLSGAGMLIRRAPFDSVVSCQEAKTFDDSRVRSAHHANTGEFQLGIRATATGNALGAEGLGIAYKPEFTGKILVKAVVELEPGSFDLLELVSVPTVIDRTGESAEILSAARVKVDNEPGAANVFRSAELLPESSACNMFVPFCQDITNYQSVVALPVETTTSVLKGQFKLVCATLVSNTVTTGVLPLGSISEAKYKGKVLNIELIPVIGQ
jgi:hypothetical protein